MRKYFVIIISIMLFSIPVYSKEKIIDSELLQKKGDRYYMPNEKSPFTGTSVYKYGNGKVKYKRNFKDGKWSGKSIDYYKSGQIQAKGNFKDGKLEGEWIDYYKSGKVMSKCNYKNNEFDGEGISYYENGKVFGNYKDSIKLCLDEGE